MGRLSSDHTRFREAFSTGSLLTATLTSAPQPITGDFDADGDADGVVNVLGDAFILVGQLGQTTDQ